MDLMKLDSNSFHDGRVDRLVFYTIHQIVCIEYELLAWFHISRMTKNKQTNKRDALLNSTMTLLSINYFGKYKSNDVKMVSDGNNRLNIIIIIIIVGQVEFCSHSICKTNHTEISELFYINGNYIPNNKHSVYLCFMISPIRKFPIHIIHHRWAH